VSGSAGAFDYAIDVKHERSNGFNGIPSSPPAQNDGDTSVAGHVRLGFQIDADQRLEASVLANNLLSAYNDGYGDPKQWLYYQLRTVGLNWSSRWSDAYNTQLGVSETTNQINSAYGNYATDLRSYLFQNDWHWGIHQFTLTLDGREDKLISSSAYDPIAGSGDRFSNALALGYGLHWQEHSLQLNVRHDQNSVLGGHNSASAAYGYVLAPHWRATVSAATGYRAPTLYEQYSLYGVSSLLPQTSQNLEAALRYEDGASAFGVVAYHNRVSNLINFGGPGDCQSPYGCYANVGRALMEGVTLTAQQRFQGINTHASLDLQDPKDLATGDLLARRAKAHGVLGADTQWAQWTLGGEAQASGRRFDDAANTQALGAYTLFNLYASKPLATDWQLVARVDNLANKNYELAYTYATPGRSVYMGLKWAPH
jgi:vitamin B12 transporter